MPLPPAQLDHRALYGAVADAAATLISYAPTDGDDQIAEERGVFAANERELAHIRSFIPRGRLALDIGSGSGLYTYRILSSAGRCIGFEPRPDAAMVTAHRMAPWSRSLAIVNCAISETETIATLRVPTNYIGWSTIDSRNELESLDDREHESLDVATLVVDNMRLHDVGFIKIDVEGHEGPVLASMVDTIRRCRPRFLIEATDITGGTTVEEIFEFFETLGYDAFRSVDGAFVPTDLLDYSDSSNVNAAFVPSESLEPLEFGSGDLGTLPTARSAKQHVLETQTGPRSGHQGSTVDRACVELIHELGIENVLIWGYRDRHTYRFIHQGFYRAFQWLGRKAGVRVEWRDDRDTFEPVPPSTLVLTMMNSPRIDEQVELGPDTLLWLHKSGEPVPHYERFLGAHAAGRVLLYDEFRRPRDYDRGEVYPLLKTVLDRSPSPVEVVRDPSSPLHWHVPSIGQAVMTWGTDLLPHEILERRAGLSDLLRSRTSPEVCWIGSVWKPNYERVAALALECDRRGLEFRQYGEYVVPEFSLALQERGIDPDAVINKRYVPLEENVDIVGAALLAPAIQSDAQLSPEGGPSYVPCRLYKNMSYGHLGASNNPTAELLFGEMVVTAPVMGELIQASLDALATPDVEDRIAAGMDAVAADHTYVSRIKLLLEAAVARRDYCS